MKKIIKLIMIFLSFFLVFSCNNKTDEALELNNKIIKDQAELFRLKENLFHKLNESSPDTELQLSYDSLKTFLLVQIENYNNLEPITDDNEFINSMVELLLTYQNLTSNEYYQLKKIITKPAYLIDNNDINNIDSLYNLVNIKHQDAFNTFSEAQKKFAHKFNIELVD